ADISLKGPGKNTQALGAKVFLFSKGEIHSYEKYPVHGFLSSAETPIHIGLGNTSVDSAFLVWPDNSFERIDLTKSRLTFTYRPGLPQFDYRLVTENIKNPGSPAKDITASTNLLYKHQENDFHEFDREPLLPHMFSTEGPAVAVGDINKDGLDDVFIGASKWKKPAVFLQNKAGTFTRLAEPGLDRDSTNEHVDACFIDVNKDGAPDLIIADGGNEYYGQETWREPQVYLGDGKGGFKHLDHAFDNIFMNASCITPADIDNDGNIDLFIGGRSVPFEYGRKPRSYLLKGDGTGHFTDVTSQYAPDLTEAGFVTSAQWFDLDGNGQKDLLLTLEWDGIFAFLNKDGHLTKTTITDKKGWWNCLLPVDLNHDGKMDFVAGNLGWNSRLKASDKEPVRLYYYDFDGNGKKEQILTYYLNGKELPFANKHELEKQIPSLKKNYLYAENFAKASLEDLFSRDKLDKADLFTANYFSNALLINQGNGRFEVKALPWEAQLSPFRDAMIVDADHDSLPDVLLVGNYYDNNIQMGRYDADFGTLLFGRDGADPKPTPLNGLTIKGQVRHSKNIKIAGKDACLLIKNNDSAQVIQFAR
ncbi:MAG TPA: FG-GAP-like repeat-containing protein, partial [Puia sp.]